MSFQSSLITSLGRNLHPPDKDDVSSLSPRSWPWLRAAAIGNARSLAKPQCSPSRCDASCLWAAAPLCTLGSRRAIGHNRHEGNEAMVADDLKDEQTKRTHVSSYSFIILHVLNLISGLMNLPRHVKFRPDTWRDLSFSSFFSSTQILEVY